MFTTFGFSFGTTIHDNNSQQFTELFKVEWRCGGFVGLNAKTYYCFDPDGQFKEKSSTKEISNAANLRPLSLGIRQQTLDRLSVQLIEDSSSRKL